MAINVPDDIQVSLVSISVANDCGSHSLVFFGRGCDTKRIAVEVGNCVLDKMNAQLKKHGYGEILPMIMVVERLDRSPEVLEAIRLIVGDEKITLAPKRKHYSAISRLLLGADNKLLMDLQ